MVLFYVCIGRFTWDWNRLLPHGVKRLGNIDLGLKKSCLYISGLQYFIYLALMFQKFGIYFFTSDLLRDCENDPLTRR